MPGRKNPVTHSVRLIDHDSGIGTDAVFELGDDGLPRLVKLTVTAAEGGVIAARDLRALPLSEVQALAAQGLHEAVSGPVHPVVVVARPDGSDRWYREFAAYFQLAQRHRPASPASLIAEQSDVPVTAVRRWTRETRRRGFLPPDPRGKRSK